MNTLSSLYGFYPCTSSYIPSKRYLNKCYTGWDNSTTTLPILELSLFKIRYKPVYYIKPIDWNTVISLHTVQSVCQ